MNQAFHQFVQLILQGLTWVAKTCEALWVWSWSQIGSLFDLAWADMPAWKLAIGVLAIAVLATLLVGVALRAWEAFARIASAFWTMAITTFALLTFVVLAGLFSRGFQWVVASVPNTFWDKFI